MELFSERLGSDAEEGVADKNNGRRFTQPPMECCVCTFAAQDKPTHSL